MSKYIDEKVTIWRRHYFTEETDMKALSENLQEHKDKGEVISDLEGWKESEILHDTEQEITTKENLGRSTLEVYSNPEENDFDPIWSNETKKALSKTQQIKNVLLSMQVGDKLYKNEVIEMIWGQVPSEFNRGSFDVLKQVALKELAKEGHTKLNFKSKYNIIYRDANK